MICPKCKAKKMSREADYLESGKEEVLRCWICGYRKSVRAELLNKKGEKK